MPPSLHAITTAVTIAIILAAAYTDIRWRRVFDAITYTGMALGLALGAAAGGWHGLLNSVLGMLVGIAVLILVAFMGNVMGGGDIKLIIAIGALQGPAFLFHALIYTFLIGGILALVVALYRRGLGRAFARAFTGIYARFAFGVPMDMDTTDKRMRLPYALAIGLGTVACLTVPWPL